MRIQFQGIHIFHQYKNNLLELMEKTEQASKDHFFAYPVNDEAEGTHYMVTGRDYAELLRRMGINPSIGIDMFDKGQNEDAIRRHPKIGDLEYELAKKYRLYNSNRFALFHIKEHIQDRRVHHNGLAADATPIQEETIQPRA